MFPTFSWLYGPGPVIYCNEPHPRYPHLLCEQRRGHIYCHAVPEPHHGDVPIYWGQQVNYSNVPQMLWS